MTSYHRRWLWGPQIKLENIWRVSSSGMWRRIVCWDATDVSEERRLHLNRLHGVIFQKTILFISTAVKTSNPTLRIFAFMLAIYRRVCNSLQIYFMKIRNCVERTWNENLRTQYINYVNLKSHYRSEYVSSEQADLKHSITTLMTRISNAVQISSAQNFFPSKYTEEICIIIRCTHFQMHSLLFSMSQNSLCLNTALRQS
jgi:hypothetical protein